MHFNVIDISGKKYGNWTVLSYDKTQKSVTYWSCVCICGKKKSIAGKSLREGRSTSCGCTKKPKVKHGMAATKTYKSWHAMIQRCEGKGGHESYPARGITVCDAWINFDGFFADMGIRPNGSTLDRVDNKKGYSKDNCRWATPKEQSNNRNNTKYVTVHGETMPLIYACQKYNIGISAIRHRLRKLMSDQDAFTKPLRGYMNKEGIFVKEQ